MAAAVTAGLLTGPSDSIAGIPVLAIYDFLGTIFLNALKMLIVPIILSSIITGVSGIGQGKDLGRMGFFTIIYYLATSLIAILTGLAMVYFINPGIHNGVPAGESLGLDSLSADIAAKISGREAGDLAGIFLRMIPPNIVKAASEGRILGLIFFGILMGSALSQLRHSSAVKTVIRFWDGLFQTMMLMTRWIMKLAPAGIFGLVARVTASTGLDAFSSLAWFFLTVIMALAVHAFLILPGLLLMSGISPLNHARIMLPALVTAFSTASSSATLPITLECLEKDTDIPNRITSFVLPLGATVNMDGTALYECVAAIFIAQAYGLDLGFVQSFTIVLAALFTSIGVAGIPAASLIAITIILGTIGLPAEAIAPILVVDRLLDMCRTSVNVFSDSCGTAIIAKLEERTGLGAVQK